MNGPFEIEEWEAKQTLLNPDALYIAVLNGDYRRAPDLMEGDSEFVTTVWTYKGNAVCCVMVHGIRKAYPVLMSGADLEAAIERIAMMKTGLELNAIA